MGNEIDCIRLCSRTSVSAPCHFLGIRKTHLSFIRYEKKSHPSPMARIEATRISVFVRISSATLSTLISNSASHVGEVAVAPSQLTALTLFSVMD